MFLLGLLFGFVAGFIVAWQNKPIPPPPYVAPPQFVACQHCGQPIRPEVRVCHHCQRNQVVPAPPS